MRAGLLNENIGDRRDIPYKSSPLNKIPPSPPFAKGGNNRADTSALEKQIDQMVYALYGLTPEEIAIVEEVKS
ncbi:MAG: hypothetical protein WA240_02020 [Nitrospirota bacterium]